MAGKLGAALSDNIKGALFMMISMAGFILNDMLFKLAMADLGLFQGIALRGVFASSVILLLAWHFGALAFRPAGKDRVLIAARVVSEVGGTMCYLTALSYLPIADATAILQVLPLTVTLAAALFLRERVGWRRYTAIMIGFAGVMIIVRPGGEGFDAHALWALVAVVMLTARDILTKQLSSNVPSLFVTVLTAVVITLLAGLLSPLGTYAELAPRHILLLAGAGLFLLAGYHFGVLTMRVGEISFVSPFRYTILLWAIIIGILVFGEWPDRMTLLGAFIVVVTGAYSFYRERRLPRSPNTTFSRR